MTEEPDGAYCLAANREGYHPAITFNGEEYHWATCYESPADAVMAARQMLHNAQDLGHVP